MPKLSPHVLAVLQALLVTFLWSTSAILIVLELKNIPALTFAGLRNGIAFLCLLPLLLRRRGYGPLLGLTVKDWGLLALLGLFQYTLLQGGQFASLQFLPAATVSLVIAFSPVVVALLGLALLAERPSRGQWLGLVICLAGVVVYFYPPVLPPDQRLGLLIASVGLLGAAGGGLVGRVVNRAKRLGALLVTVVSMGIGAVLLLGAGLAMQGLPPLSLRSWLVILWLAVLNTALANTLLNVALRTLSAMEVSIILNTILVQVALLAWLILGQRLSLVELLGLVAVAVGTVIVQMWSPKQAPEATREADQAIPENGHHSQDSPS